MADPPEVTAPALVVEVAKAYSLCGFFPLAHPTVSVALLGLSRELLRRGYELDVEVTPGGLRTGGEWVAPRSPHVARLARTLSGHGVRAFALRHDVGSESLGRFVSAANLPPRVARAGGGLPTAMAAAGVSRIAVDGAWIQPLPAPAPALPAGGGGGSRKDAGLEGIALWSAQDAYEQVRLSASRVENENLDELRASLRTADEAQRVELLNRLEFLAQRYLQRGEMDQAVGLMNALRQDAEEMQGRNPAGRGAVIMALHRMAGPALIDELVERLGRARGEEARNALKATLVHLGAEVVTQLVRALIDATDLSARRAYRDALVGLDDVGVPLLEDMVGDDRWFVVRNMVGILGEIRSSDAYDHFAATIAHADGRVRRETILALSKMGGEDAVPLLAKGLQDAEAGLRGAAALGLGLVKQPAGVTPLIQRLGRESEKEVVREIVRALGRIGDARAVPVLAERAASGWLKMTSSAARVDATKALGEIGGEQARAVLQRLARDRSADVREAALRGLDAIGASSPSALDPDPDAAVTEPTP